jgi:hypothetical protein
MPLRIPSLSSLVQKAAWLWVGLWVSGCASGSSYVCPDKVHLASASLAASDVPAGFQAAASTGPVRLSGVSVFDGPPEQGAQLVPTQADERDTHLRWRFEGLSGQGVWLACHYADQLLQLTVKVDGQPTECQASVLKQGQPQALHAQFTCR